MNGSTHPAPWGRSLIVASTLATIVLLAAVLVPQFQHQLPAGVNLLLFFLPLLLLPGAALFTIRSYTLELGVLLIQRLLWQTRIPLAGLQSAEFLPGVMRWSLRLFGNGGLYSITGLYRNQALGNYRAFVTDGKRTVVLRFAARTVVISPENPERFVQEISEMISRKFPIAPAGRP